MDEKNILMTYSHNLTIFINFSDNYILVINLLLAWQIFLWHINVLSAFVLLICEPNFTYLSENWVVYGSNINSKQNESNMHEHFANFKGWTIQIRSKAVKHKVRGGLNIAFCSPRSFIMSCDEWNMFKPNTKQKQVSNGIIKTTMEQLK